MKKVLRVILWDQLSQNVSSLRNIDKENDVILMCEVSEECTYVKHHKKKLSFLLSAMRHFKLELEENGYKVHYVKLDSINNSGSITGEIRAALETDSFSDVVITHPSEYRIMENIKKLQKEVSTTINILDDDRFLINNEDFKKWVDERKILRMEDFYRIMRKKYNILMVNNKPEGGKWNYDSENRNFFKNHELPKTRHIIKIDPITTEVIKIVENIYSDHFGDIHPFNLAVTRKDAIVELFDFIKTKLRFFGSYQDAMIEGEPFLYHSHISAYINIGLLSPLECILYAQEEYRLGNIPINAAEGFIRQILGWREYVRGIYWLKMPEYKKMNFLSATRKLPWFYWTGDTDMNCIKQCVIDTKKNAYAHHIQRLMVLGNFALISGINPDEVNEWYMIVYADAFEWVELPNVTGMTLFADGGYLGSKPYAGSGSYIRKMSNYCKNCRYKVDVKNGSNACPFNYLYWDFLIRNREKLKNNYRLQTMYQMIDKMDNTRITAIKKDSENFLETKLF